MQDDNRSPANLPELRIMIPNPNGDVEVSPDYIAVPVTPEMLIRICHEVQQWIPGFTQLSLKERRSMARAGNLDRDFIEAGVAAALAAGPYAKVLTAGLTGEECRELNTTIRGQEEVEREYAALMKGIAATLLKHNYTLGNAVLNLYFNLGQALRGRGTEHLRHLRPYLDRMTQAYKTGATGGRRKAKKEAPPPETPTE